MAFQTASTFLMTSLIASSITIFAAQPPAAISQVQQQVQRGKEIERNLQEEQEQGLNTRFQMQQEGFPTAVQQGDSEDMDSGDEAQPEGASGMQEMQGAPRQRNGAAAVMDAGDQPSTSNLPITGGAPLLPQFDRIMLSILETNNIPGGALAIAKDGKLVLARGYGFAIKERNVPFSPTTRFCLASVTKAMTGAAAMHLVDEGKLNLDDKLYDVLGRPEMPNVSDRRVFDITIRQLLHHSGGWKTDFVGYSQEVNNALTKDGAIPAEQLILHVMRTQPLDYDPGSECHYSNFQFAVLKCAIDHAAGQPYEEYVIEHVLKPMGITDMQLEPVKGTYLQNEAHRYGPKGHSLPGGRPTMQLTGGMGSWEASAVDMAKFLTAIDATRTKPFLSNKMYNAMLAPPAPPAPVNKSGSHFGLGWDTAHKDGNGVSFSKNGGVGGVHTLMAHLPDNVDFVFFLNGTGTKGITARTSRTLKSAIAAVRGWPNVDLFNEY
jgi:N-acyl-D-amino-acid deacylase